MAYSYVDYVNDQKDRNPCLHRLADFLADANERQVHPAIIFCIDYSQDEAQSPQSWQISPKDGETHAKAAQNLGAQGFEKASSAVPEESLRESKLREVTTISPDCQGRLILVENIDRLTLIHLSTQYDIAPLFFATYLDSTFSKIEDHSPPP
ncbi:hypothetical protein BU16DRAFT_565284 [Lophium mytilinum]|uniref:Uncharacterized protein n=1 Tax=Lophium mytilinum TaxID=390894 RepID=A0A6A6QHS0_9PEZI|nr:hypothetical protein BU16DRAFT_565284 [Lophium mytilinum]